MIKCNVSNVAIEITETETLTAGRVGLECQFTFSSEWDGLAITAYFLGETTNAVVVNGNTVVVPAASMVAPGYKLYVGVVGRDAQGNIVIPTLWASAGKIKTSPGEEEEPTPSPDVVAQIQLMAINAVNTANAAMQVITDHYEEIEEVGADQVAAVNAAGTTQTENVNTAGATQVAAVQAKGKEVLDSIPEDYTELSNDVSDLKSALTQTADLTIERTGNDFVWESGTFSANGVDVANSARARTTKLIPCLYYKSITGSETVDFVVGVFDSGGNILGYYNGSSIVSSGVWMDSADLAPIQDKQIRIAIRLKADPTSDIAPSTGNTNISFVSALRSDIEGLISNIAEIDDEFLNTMSEYIVTKPTYHNYFDPFSDDIHFGHYYFNSNMLDSAALACVKIELPVNKTYYLKVDVTGFGPSNAIKIPCWKASDGTYISNKIGTLDTETEILTLSNLNTQTTEDTIIIGYTFRPVNVSKSFIIDSPVTAIPPVEDLYEIPKENILAGKKALFFGDSICQASAVPLADTNQYQFGWAGRIGYYNLMNWRNYGNSGASITNMSGRSCISTIVSTNIALHPDADYIIVEGGTNDADVIASSSDYSVGTFAEDDYTSTYDLTTFCGSLETMLRNIIKTYPNRKIGYIVAPKMGQYDGVMRNRREIFEKASAICRKWGVTFVDLWGECQINPRLVEYYDPSLTQAENIASKYYVDGQHLTDKGYDLITPLIEQWMKTM